MLEITAPRYAVSGAIARPWQRHPQHRDIRSLAEFVRFDQPGWTKYLTDFRLEPHDGDVQLITETRGCSTDAWARRRFALYWTLIRPASGLVRRDMLITISRLATRTHEPIPQPTNDPSARRRTPVLAAYRCASV
ncbi:MAG: hypothetical protein ACR2OB_01590 [Solirubrobacteraceae bacterium]